MWDQLAASGDTGGVKMARVDMTVKTKQRSFAKDFGIRAFPTLLFFKKGGKKIYRFSGARTYDALRAFARGGWKTAEEYDPSKQPPPKPRKSITETLQEVFVTNWKLATAFGVVMASTILFAIFSACRARAGGEKLSPDITGFKRPMPAKAAGKED